MGAGVASEDDNKMIVETELVEANTTPNILPVSQQPMPSVSEVDDDGASIAAAGKEEISQKHVRQEALDVHDLNATLKASHSLQTQETGSSSVQHLEGENQLMSHPHTNPLSTHTSSNGLRNKKSSLLIDCAVDGEEDSALQLALNSDQLLDISMASKEASHELPSLASSMVNSLVKPKSKVQLKNLQSYREDHEHAHESTPEQADVPRQRQAQQQQAQNQQNFDQQDLQDSGNGEFHSQKQHLSQFSSQPSQLKTNSQPGLLSQTSSSLASATQLPSSTLTDSESVRKFNKESSSKADFFAARLATAVGENEVSDSEETFVYQSTANSIKNGSLNDHSATPNNTITSIQPTNATKPYGITQKLSAPQLKQNDKLLNRLKNTRHTSIAAIPNSQGTISSNSEKDDITSLRSVNRTSMQELQSVKSYRTQMSESPRKRLSMASLSKSQSRQQQKQNQASHNTPAIPGNTGPAHISSTTPTRSSFALGPKKSTKQGSRTQRIMKQPLHSSNQQQQQHHQQQPQPNRRNLSRQGDPKKTALRTRSSKVFDPNGSSLRRYSGVPDDVNLEDFVDQYDGDLDLTNIPSKKIDSNPNANYNSSNLPSQHGMHTPKRDAYDPEENNSPYEDEVYDDENVDGEAEDIDTTSEISDMQRLRYHDQNNYDELSYVDEDEDDMHSMFYYNGNANMQNQFRPGRRFSEFDENVAEDLEARGHYYGDHNHNRHPSHSVLANPGQNHYLNYNEYTPLKTKIAHRKRSDLNTDYSPHNFYTQKSSWTKFRNFIYFSFIVSSLLTLGFISGFLLATNKELHDFQIIDMDNILVSLDELVFDMTATAFNPGLFTIGIQTVELDIFAKTDHLKDSDNNDEMYTAPFQTILLGTVYSLETELQFRGRFINRNFDVSVASLKLINPGAPKKGEGNGGDQDDDDKQHPSNGNHKLENDIDRWKELIKYEFELIVRGNMYYTIPFFNNEKVIPVQQQITVDPSNSPYNHEQDNIIA